MNVSSPVFTSSKSANTSLSLIYIISLYPLSDPLPFIFLFFANLPYFKTYLCVDRFFGKINVDNVTTHESSLCWSAGPGENISHYRVEVTGDYNWSFNETGLTTQILNLTAGTQYNVQVFPVKCGRDLNPQNVSFYTRPSGVGDLTVVCVTNDSVKLNWTKPEGNRDFYSIQVSDKSESQKFDTEESVIVGLIPGNQYIFTVRAVVNNTTNGVPSNISTYTMPSQVSCLKSADNDSNGITASWDQIVGNTSGYLYCLNEITECIKCNVHENSSDCTNCTIITDKPIQVNGKIPGTRHYLCVAALTDNNTLNGQMVQINAYTRPSTVNITLTANSQTIFANWNIDGNYKTFNVSISKSADSTNESPKNGTTTDRFYNFTELNAGMNYNITVVTLLENGLQSDPATKSIYTKPTSPGPVTATALNSTAIMLTWEAPRESLQGTITYNVTCWSSYWNEGNNATVQTENNIFYNLKSGTKYDFCVYVVAGGLTSNPVCASEMTVPKKKKLTFTVLCTTGISLYCSNNMTPNATLKELSEYIERNFNHSNIHWTLKSIDRK
ncbi:receptor-type tyrosine-protein phosphatase eta-like [Xyrauchen texanus]|uniref:receptor-type tyrosine-protein phosphatase eta-like n=1 Tax=Xyrauchen texanus TaxID=154827 RepID=UPI002241D496|nr:receptor-type tyrosine-protein phosphatase eta-like [Xyrauchen texanus]